MTLNTDSSPSEALATKPKKASAKKTTNKKVVKKQKKTNDLIEGTVIEVENLTKKAAIKLVRELAEDVDYSYFRLGGVLSVIQSNAWFHDDGYDTFKDFVTNEFGINYRKAMYLVAIYNSLVDSEVPWGKVKKLGWSKLKELAHVLNKENVDEWVTIAEGMTVIQLQDYIKVQAESGSDTPDAAEASKSTVTRLSFKVHEDQKEIIMAALEKSKQAASTEFDSVALEAICMDYLSAGSASPKSNNKAKPADLKQLMEAADPSDVLDLFDKIHPDMNITVEV